MALIIDPKVREKLANKKPPVSESEVTVYVGKLR
jgi:hypothetical protein